ncbi:copper oxidase [Cellvibrio zantedeschiae]|uniref:Copper oxidase n=1 Tax=Cellvibrio zantedeschiae TaxID=1237077 RepID=A0ABQ3AZM2_9GAMM|nr:copper resistance system multicopper oxidase [Cellvibrio zantedeschiae]GGY69164.1 copper oxidase [Cellvibrio zantedeschiae]
MNTFNSPPISRRHFVLGASSAVALTALPFSQALSAETFLNSKNSEVKILSGNQFDLQIGYQTVNYTGKNSIATTVNGSLPAPILRWKEGERVRLRVTNNLHEDSSIHWHGIILPSTMDGSPGFDFAGIKPGETFEYEFDVKQSGTYWYHSHSGFQEQTGLLGAIIIDPKEPDPISYDRDLVILLSDWTDTAPAKIYSRLKKMSHYYNYRERTIADTWADIKANGIAQTWSERAMWNRMRMSDTDIADVSGYTYLMNGVSPAQNWTGFCKPGEKIRLRFINGAAMTIFDVRIPRLKMTVVAADGQAVQPVIVDEFRIGNAETYDVIVTLDTDKAHTLFAQTIDRTGFTCGILTTNLNLRAEIPALDAAPVLGHQDMGMDMSGMDHSNHTAPAKIDHSLHDMNTANKSEPDHSHHNMNAAEMDHSGHDMSAMEGMDHSNHNMHATPSSVMENLAKAGFGSNFDQGSKSTHYATEFGPHVDMHSEMPRSGLNDPGIGLRDHQEKYNRKVLRYADLRSLHPTQDKRQPTREIELHLNGNMHRYMWSINGESFMNAAPIELTYGERIRIILVNDTMMTHPIHLHGMWSELETGDPDFIPRKHTILVQPGSKISYLVTADAKGRWAYHCHLLYHMLGMMRMVKVV